MRSGTMIIKCLLPYLHRFRHNVHFREFSGQTAAIDASCWIHKALSVGISQSRNRENVKYKFVEQRFIVFTIFVKLKLFSRFGVIHA